MNVEQLNNELSLVINNTQELYTAATQMTDFEVDNNQVSNLTAAAFRTIRSNTSGDVDPYNIITSMPDTKAVVVEIVKGIQQEAEA